VLHFEQMRGALIGGAVAVRCTATDIGDDTFLSSR
jgi:hypothetical protein